MCRKFYCAIVIFKPFDNPVTDSGMGGEDSILIGAYLPKDALQFLSPTAHDIMRFNGVFQYSNHCG